jgi:hypothetical protein
LTALLHGQVILVERLLELKFVIVYLVTGPICGQEGGMALDAPHLLRVVMGVIREILQVPGMTVGTQTS